MLQEMTSSLQRRPSVGHVLWELTGCIASAVGADGHRLYLPDTGDSESLCLYLGHSDSYVLYRPRGCGTKWSSATLWISWSQPGEIIFSPFWPFLSLGLKLQYCYLFSYFYLFCGPNSQTTGITKQLTSLFIKRLLLTGFLYLPSFRR